MAILQSRLAKHSIVFLELLVLAYLVATEELASSALLLFSAIAFVGIVAISWKDWPFGAIVLLIGSSAMPRFKGTLLGLHVRPEHVGIAFVAAAMLWLVLQGRMRTAFHLQRFDYYLIGYILLNFLTSAVASPEPRLTLRWAAMNAIVIVPYFLLRVLIKSEAIFFKAFEIMLWVGAVESAYGIFCFLSNRIFATAFGMEIGQYGMIPGTYGTQYEPNLFGSYSACCAIVFLALFLLGDRSRWHGFGCLVTVLGAAVSLSRAVILAFPVVALIVVWIAYKRGSFQLRKFVPLAASVAVLLLIISPFLLGLLRERFSTIDLGELSADDTTAGRIVQMAVAIQDVQAHPVFGTGTASFQLLFNWEDYLGEDLGGWVGNTPLRIVHDTGFVGLTVFLLFVGSLILAARKTIRFSPPKTKYALISLQAGLLLYAITFQSSEASLLAFTWIHFGVLAAAVTSAQAHNPALLRA